MLNFKKLAGISLHCSAVCYSDKAQHLKAWNLHAAWRMPKYRNKKNNTSVPTILPHPQNFSASMSCVCNCGIWLQAMLALPWEFKENIPLHLSWWWTSRGMILQHWACRIVLISGSGTCILSGPLEGIATPCKTCGSEIEQPINSPKFDVYSNFRQPSYVYKTLLVFSKEQCFPWGMQCFLQWHGSRQKKDHDNID